MKNPRQKLKNVSYTVFESKEDAEAYVEKYRYHEQYVVYPPRQDAEGYYVVELRYKGH